MFKRRLEPQDTSENTPVENLETKSIKPVKRKRVEVEDIHTTFRHKARNLKLKEFIPDEDLELGYRIAVLGQTGSGKSVVTWALCHAYAPVIDLALVFCPTAEENNYSDIVPPSCIFEEFDEEYILNLIRYQNRCAKKYGRENLRSILVILDDLSFDSKMCRTKGFRKLFCNGRHANITVIMTTQFVMDMPTTIRAQLQMVFTAREFTDNIMEKLHDNYFSAINKYQDFRRVMDEITQERTMLVLRKSFKDAGSPDRLLFWYQAPFPKAKFKLGDPAIWEEDARCYVDDTEERENMDRKLQFIKAQIEEDKQPLYDIIKDESRPRIPANSLSARYQKQRTIYNVQASQIQPKAMNRVKGPPMYNIHTARAFHGREDMARKRMRKRFGI